MEQDPKAAAGRGYIYVEMRIRDPQGLQAYSALSAPAVHAAGGKYIVLGSIPQALEGTANPYPVVIVEFETAAKAREFYHPAAYQAAREKRLDAADFTMLLLEGKV